MSFEFIANLIIVLCVLGILVLFLRRLPEVVEEKGQLALRNREDSVEPAETGALLKSALTKFQNLVIRGWKKIWHFTLEAKDLKQGQILASKFAQFVKPRAKITNIGAFNTIKKANRLTEEGKLDEAEENYIQVIRKHPHEYQAYEGLLKIYFKQKKMDDIVEILEFLIKHNPQNDMYLAQLGNALLTMRRYQDAAEVYQRSLEVNPLIPARFVNYGLALQGVGSYAEARKNFEKAVDLDPGNMQYLMILVDAMVKIGDQEAAIKKLRAASEQDPDNAEIREKLISLES